MSIATRWVARRGLRPAPARWLQFTPGELRWRDRSVRRRPATARCDRVVEVELAPQSGFVPRRTVGVRIVGPVSEDATHRATA